MEMRQEKVNGEEPVVYVVPIRIVEWKEIMSG